MYILYQYNRTIVQTNYAAHFSEIRIPDIGQYITAEPRSFEIFYKPEFIGNTTVIRHLAISWQNRAGWVGGGGVGWGVVKIC